MHSSLTLLLSFPGVFGGNAVLLSSLVSCEVVTANGKVTAWTWDRDPDQMRALCCGLGMTGVVLSVTFQCVPLQRY